MKDSPSAEPHPKVDTFEFELMPSYSATRPNGVISGQDDDKLLSSDKIKAQIVRY